MTIQNPRSKPKIDYSIVRILNQESVVFGGGYYVHYDYILTCCHVLADALGISRDTKEKPLGTILIDFPKSDSNAIIQTRIKYWNQKSDVAILNIDDEVPLGCKPAVFTFETELKNHRYEALGFPPGYFDGIWSQGEIFKSIANGWYQIEKAKVTGHQVVKGFSGCPVWDETLGAVCGIVVATDIDEQKGVAFIIPLALIKKSVLDERLRSELFPPKKKLKISDAINNDLFHSDIKLAFENLEFDKKQTRIFNNLIQIDNKKVFAYVVHGNTDEHGQKWHYNKLIRIHNLSNFEPIPFSFNSSSLERNEEAFVEELIRILDIKKSEFEKPNWEEVIEQRFLKKLLRRDFVFIIESSNIAPILNIILPFCQAIFSKISLKNPIHKLLFIVFITEELEFHEESNYIFCPSSLSSICKSLCADWIETLQDVRSPLLVEHFKKTIDKIREGKDISNDCEQILTDYRKLKKLGFNIKITKTPKIQEAKERKDVLEIPAERFMKKVSENINLNWNEFSRIWMKY